MRIIVLTLIISFSVICGYAQSSFKTTYAYNKFLHLRGTEFSVASVENHSKLENVKSYLLFINTLTGDAKQIEFAEGARLGIIQQVKIDNLEINLVLVVANTVSLDNKKDIDWRDPRQIFVFSPNGENMKQLTDDNFYVHSWSINEFTGALIVSGYFDKNRNRKKDKDENNEILLFDLKTETLKKRL
jgi:hypothetical protein